MTHFSVDYDTHSISTHIICIMIKHSILVVYTVILKSDTQ